MKKLLFIFTVLMLTSIAISAQVNKKNVQNYVESMEIYHEDDEWVTYDVKFTDGEFDSIAYNKKNGVWYDNMGITGCRIGESTNEALFWLWEKLH